MKHRVMNSKGPSQQGGELSSAMFSYSDASTEQQTGLIKAEGVLREQGIEGVCSVWFQRCKFHGAEAG